MPNIIGNNGKKNLFMKNFKLFQNFDEAKLSRINILLSLKTIVIVSDGSISFIIPIGFMFSCFMHLYANFGMWVLPTLEFNL